MFCYNKIPGTDQPRSAEVSGVCETIKGEIMGDLEEAKKWKDRCESAEDQLGTLKASLTVPESYRGIVSDLVADELEATKARLRAKKDSSS